METLVIKNNLLSGGTQKLYRDVIVEKGTLFCFDFSNAGCVSNDDLTTVRDLALESKQELGIPNNVSFNVTDRGSVPALNEKKGYPLVDLGSYSSTAYDSGLNVFGIDEYLFDKQPEKMVWTMWLSLGDIVDSSSTQWLKSGNLGNFYAQGRISVTMNFNASSIVSNPMTVNSIQLSVERQGNGMPNKIYINGKYVEDGPANAAIFLENTVGNPLSIGAKSPLTDTNLVLYRAFMEDLTESGRTALEVVQKDYNYVNALGEFAGIEPRPFANLV